ncbi:MAG: hypothetical protein OXG35_22015 [Acidobacteria bacterium]|nr:hypothetical protein [Acidobacteriota bacterium]
MTTSRTRSDPGVVASALVLVAVCILVAGIIVYAGDLARGTCTAACACGEVGR